MSETSYPKRTIVAELFRLCLTIVVCPLKRYTNKKYIFFYILGTPDLSGAKYGINNKIEYNFVCSSLKLLLCNLLPIIPTFLEKVGKTRESLFCDNKKCFCEKSVSAVIISGIFSQNF